MKKKDKNLKWYLLGEFMGKLSVVCTEVLIVTSVLGVMCDLAWDISERRTARKKLNTNKSIKV